MENKERIDLNNLELDKIKSKIQQLPVLDTSDATATSEDILDTKTAYIDGKKVTGKVPTIRSDTNINGDSVYANNEKVSINFDVNEIFALGEGAYVMVIADSSDVAESAGLTADVLKKDVTVLGVEGTLESGSDPEPKPFPKLIYTGHYDIEGLKYLGYDDDTINWYQENGVNWNEDKDSLYLLTDEDREYKDLITSESDVKKYKDIRFLPYFEGKIQNSNTFNNFLNLESIPLLDTSNLTSMYNMFNYCYSLRTIPLLNTSNVVYMHSMFSYCYNLRTIPLLDTSKVTNFGNTFYYCYSLEYIPLLNTSNVTAMGSMFGYCSSLKEIPKLNTSNVTCMSYMFGDCYSLRTIPQLDTGKVTTMSQIFSNCYSLEYIPLLNTSNVTAMSSMFSHCYNLKTIPLLDTSKVTNMQEMFSYCYSLKEIPKLDTSKVTIMQSMFQHCPSLRTIPLLDTSKVTNVQSMFADCPSLEYIPLLDTSKVTNMKSMFDNCPSLRTIPSLNTSNVTNISRLFYGCHLLEYIPLLDTSNVTTMQSMFYNCYNLKSIPLLDASNVINIGTIFNSNTRLTNLGGFKNLGQSYSITSAANNSNYTLSLSGLPNITHDSLMNVINNLYDIKSKGCNAQKLVLGSTNIAKLTEEEIAIATDKGWTVS